MMRALCCALLLGVLSAPVQAQEPALPAEPLILDDPALVEGLEAMPQLDGATEVLPPKTAAPEIDGETLADIQASLRAVASDLQALRAELLASGAAGFEAAGGDTAIDRMNAMEAQIARLTDQTEQLTNRVKRVVAGGSNRLGDIEFRLCELDPNCDLGALMTAELGRQSEFGGGLSGEAVVPPPPSDISSVTLPPLDDATPDAIPPTEEEAEDFAAARAAIEAGDWAQAIPLLEEFVAVHGGGPLTVDALFLLGMAQREAGQTEQAAESWLQAFSADPDGPRAARSLLELSRAMATVASPAEACPFLSELSIRFPEAPEAAQAEVAAAELGCAADDAGGD